MKYPSLQLLSSLFILLGSICQLTDANAQPLNSDQIYPKLKTYKKTGKQSYAELNFNGCVEGDCKNGTGTAMVIFPRGGSLTTNKDEQQGAHIYLWKGTFSMDGKRFNGRSYEFQVMYEGNKERNSSKFEPLTKIDFSNEAALKENLVAEGSAVQFVFNKYDPRETRYVSDGIVIDHTRRKWSEGFRSYEGIYRAGNPEKVKITYTPNEVIDVYTGTISPTGEFLLGRAEYTDGTHYDGSFYGSKFHGPGIYYTKEGKKLQGLWQDGVLKTAQDIILPPHLFTLNTTGSPVATAYTFNFNNKSWQGMYTGDIKNGLPDGTGLFSLEDIFYYGEFKAGKPHGAGYFYACTATDQTYKKEKIIQLFSGRFVNGSLLEGSRYTVFIDKKLGEDGPYGYYSTSISRGIFAEHKLQGCGQYILIHHRSDAYDVDITGNFKNGYPFGWAYVRTSSNHPSLQTGLEYINHGH